MNNRYIQATWHHHNGTEHPNGYLLNPRHLFDPMRLPMVLKIYSDLEPISLPMGTSALSVLTLSAIYGDTVPSTAARWSEYPPY